MKVLNTPTCFNLYVSICVAFAYYDRIVFYYFLTQNTIPLRSAHTRRPAYTLRLYLLLHQSLETQHCRSYKVPIPWTQGPQGPPPTPRKPQGPPSPLPTPPPPGEGGKGPKGPGGRWERWAHGALWGYSEAIPNGKLFRSQSEWKGRSEWMALPNGKLFHAFTQPRKRRTECLRICLVGFEQFS